MLIYRGHKYCWQKPKIKSEQIIVRSVLLTASNASKETQVMVVQPADDVEMLRVCSLCFVLQSFLSNGTIIIGKLKRRARLLLTKVI
jgi:hypothetical protein